MYGLDFGYLKPETFSELDDLAQSATACLGGFSLPEQLEFTVGENSDAERICPTSLNRSKLRTLRPLATERARETANAER